MGVREAVEVLVRAEDLDQHEGCVARLGRAELRSTSGAPGSTRFSRALNPMDAVS